MASSRSSTSSSPLGHCVVCGKQTPTRCSACSNAGLEWMFFCSTAHQKLVWAVHRRVCGKNPFEWPSLSTKEAEEMWDLRFSSLEAGGEAQTWIEAFTSVLKDTAVGRTIEGDPLAASETVQKALLEKLKNPTSSLAAQELLLQSRRIATSIKLSKESHDGLIDKTVVRRIVAANPIGVLSWWQAIRRLELPSDPQIRSNLQHRLVVLIAVLAVVGTSVEASRRGVVPAEDYLEPFGHTVAEALRAVGNSQSSSSGPSRAQLSLKASLLFLLDHVGVSFSTF